MLCEIRPKILRFAALVAFGPLLVGIADVAAAEPAARDALVYKDGDRVQGKFIERAGEVIVFRADRFGEVRVPAADAVVILAETPAGPPPAAPTTPPSAVATATPAAETKAAADRAEVERIRIWEWFSPWVLTAKVRNYFGPWHGRFAFSTELVSDTADRTNLALEGHMQRKWEADELQLTARFDYSETNQLVTTDIVKGSASYRHDFSKSRFALYRPTLEWNRASTRNGVPNEYVLLQQEIGVGFSLFSTPRRKVRAGVSENLFDVWNSAPTADHASRAVASLFEETELILPWRMTLSQRGVFYVPFTGQATGWENRAELNKKLTETLSVAVRHEIRRRSPDGAAQDYTRLKLLLGVDF